MEAFGKRLLCPQMPRDVSLETLEMVENSPISMAGATSRSRKRLAGAPVLVASATFDVDD